MTDVNLYDIIKNLSLIVYDNKRRLDELKIPEIPEIKEVKYYDDDINSLKILIE